MNKCRPGPSFLLALMLALPRLLHAQQSADSLADSSKDAMAKNQIPLGVSLICDAAKIDPKKYDKKCASTQKFASEQLQKYDGYFAAGKAEFDRKDYAGALRDLGKINFGPHYDEAQRLLPLANAGLHHPEQLAADRAAMNAATAAFERGDLTTAAEYARKVTTEEELVLARPFLNRIKLYNDSIREGDDFLQKKNYVAAQQKYTFAIAIKNNGPGNPAGKLQEIATALAAAKTPPPTDPLKPGTYKPPVDVAKQPVPPSGTDNAPKIKAALAEARAAEGKKNYDAAIAAYERALALNPKLPEALQGKQRALDAMQQAHVGDPKPDPKLTAAIRNFYHLRLAEAGDAIALYLKSGGSTNTGAAHFYLGATLATREMLADPNATDHKTLLQQALAEFQQARNEHYHPIEHFISPRVLALWNQSAGQAAATPAAPRTTARY